MILLVTISSWYHLSQSASDTIEPLLIHVTILSEGWCWEAILPIVCITGAISVWPVPCAMLTWPTASWTIPVGELQGVAVLSEQTWTWQLLLTINTCPIILLLDEQTGHPSSSTLHEHSLVWICHNLLLWFYVHTYILYIPCVGRCSQCVYVAWNTLHLCVCLMFTTLLVVYICPSMFVESEVTSLKALHLG